MKYPYLLLNEAPSKIQETFEASMKAISDLDTCTLLRLHNRCKQMKIESRFAQIALKITLISLSFELYKRRQGGI
ncbi:hypothetical protein ACSMFR_05525 [Listeria aquatica]|uniref:hypothetical protein n=1 Tax=Listeria aquatica TaxID=1494960 RepID=UPI003F6FABEF